MATHSTPSLRDGSSASASASPPTPSPSRQRWRRPHISLGMLMLLVTLCGLGSAFWWRWPFVVERTNVDEAMGQEYVWTAGRIVRPRRPTGIDPFAAPNAAPNAVVVQPSKAPAPRYSYRLVEQLCDRRTETVRHGWGSELIRHGIALSFDKDGRRIGEEHWNEDHLHGPFRRWFTEGPLRVEGNYELGAKHGEWVIHHQELDGGPKEPIYIKRVECWKRGIPDGRWEWFDKDGESIRRIDFRDGLPTRPLGQQIEARLAQLMREGKIPESVLISLLEPTSIHFIETHLQDVLVYLRESTRVVIKMDAEKLILIPRKPLPREPEIEKFEVSLGEAGKILVPVDASEPSYKVEFETPEMSQYVAPTSIPEHLIKLGDIPITCEGAKDLPLIAALATILAPHKLVCDFRFGVLWITTPDEAATWQDRTGIAEIKPPRGSKLARRWEREGNLEFVNTRVEDVFPYYSEAFDIPIDTSRLRAQIRQGFAPRSLTMNLRNHPFKHSIGLILDRSGCRCRLEGETLVIEAQPHLLPPRNRSPLTP